MAVLSGYVVYFIVVYRRKQRNFEWERAAFRQALLKTQVEIKEQTLRDISRELHDNFGQIASLVKINLNLVLPGLSPEDSEKVAESLELVKQLINDIKSLSVSLNSENLDRFGLLKMMEKDMERYRKATGMEIIFSGPPELPGIENATEIFLYRMSQEIFNNIIRHADASVVEVKIEKVDNDLIFYVSDNGRGFEYSIDHGGSGLANLRNRSRMIGAELEIKSAPDRGTTITLELKL